MKHLLSIREREKSYQLIIILVIVVCFGFAGGIYFMGHQEAIENKKNIYVLVNDKTLVRAKSTDITNSRDILTQGAVEHIHKLIYEVVPDISQINKQLKEAVSSSDANTANFIDALKQKSFYQIVISQNYFTILDTDSINVDYSTEPCKFNFKGRLRIIRGSNQSLREIYTEGFVQNTNRSYINNERCFIVSRLRLISDREIKTQNNTN